MGFVLVRIGVLLVSVGMIKVIRGEGWVRKMMIFADGYCCKLTFLF